VGDRVWLSAKNIRSIRPKKKLDSLWKGPFDIAEEINPVAFRLKLPTTWRIHNTFHISLLRKHIESKRFPTEIPPAWEELDDEDDDVYDVEKIQDRRLNNNGLWEYKVLWKGYPEEDASWVEAADISETALKAFQRNLRKQKRAGTFLSEMEASESDFEPPVRRRGRPKKRIVPTEPKRRGRPPKKLRGS